MVILLLILMPGDQLPISDDVFSFDKFAHTGVFCILTFLMIIGFSKQYKFQILRDDPAKYSMITSAVYASILELGQIIIPDRHADFYDLAFNLIGVFLGYGFFLLVYKSYFVWVEFK